MRRRDKIAYMEDRDTKKSRILYALGAVLALIGTVIGACLAITQEMGLLNVETEALGAISIVSVGCLVISIIFLIKALPDIIIHEIEKKNKPYYGQGFPEGSDDDEERT